MANTQVSSMEPKQLLSLVAQVLHQCFFEANRDQAKQIFNEADKGKQAPLFNIKMDNGQELQGNLVLDKSEFIGKFNYSGFRSALGVMIGRIVEKLKKEEDLNIMTSQDGREILFNIPGFVETDGNTNIMVMGSTQNQPGIILVKLMFLDPTQFVKSDQEQPSTES